MRKRLYLLLLALSLYPAQSPWAASGSERLERFFKDVHTLRADFEQQVFNARSELVQKASGRVTLQRPGRFRWDYTTPYHQVIVADGKTLWIYDADLDQVTEKPLDTLVKDTPAVLLSSDASLKDSFDVKDLGQQNGMAWVELLPRAGASNFKRVRLGFDQQGPRVMELTDGFDQLTRLSFSHVVLNAPVDPGLFQFQPPAGVDVIKE